MPAVKKEGECLRASNSIGRLARSVAQLSAVGQELGPGVGAATAAGSA